MSKTKTTTKEFAEGLLYVLPKYTNSFYEEFGAYAWAKLGIKPDDEQVVTLKREIYMINMWIISKALSPDKKVLDELHKIYLLPHVNQDQINQWLKNKENENLKNVLKHDERELNERYAKYYSEWDGSGNLILAMTMLEYMFNKGQSDKRFVNADLSVRVNSHVMRMMLTILDSRKDHDIVDEEADEVVSGN